MKNIRKIFVVALLLALVLGLLFFLGSITSRTDRKDKLIQYTITGTEIPDEVEFYNGVIREVWDDYIIIEASSTNNYLSQDAFIKVLINSQTKIFMNYLPNVISEQVRKITIQQELVEQKILEIGQTVVVDSRAYTNTKDISELFAEQIDIISSKSLSGI